MDYLGNPQNEYKVIHVAGTSGKTSTCYYTATLLRQTGSKVGLSVSPHIDEINERVQINQKPLSENIYCKEFSIFLNHINKSGINPTYFELLTAFAFWEFKRQKCEYVVMEVGLGGLLDATNVISSSNKVSIITDIGIDHEEVLGKTKTLIATQKSGIIKPHTTVVCYEQEAEVMNVIREVASQQQADMHEVRPRNNKELPPSLPLFQRRNWYLAYSVYKIIAKRDGLPNLREVQLEKSIDVVVPARMEVRTINKKLIILDGSHNQQKLEALAKSIKHTYPGHKFVVLLSFVSSKQAKIKECIKALIPITEKFIISTFETEHQERTSVDPFRIVAACEDLQFYNWEIKTDPKKALENLKQSQGTHKLVTGSFYILNHIRPLM